MAKRKHHTPEQIIHLLRQAEVELAGGQPLAQVCRKLGVSEQTAEIKVSGSGSGTALQTLCVDASGRVLGLVAPPSTRPRRNASIAGGSAQVSQSISVMVHSGRPGRHLLGLAA